MFNLTGQSRDRWLLGYDIKINTHKPSMVTNSPKGLPKGLGCCCCNALVVNYIFLICLESSIWF